MFKHTELTDRLLQSARSSFERDGGLVPIAFVISTDKVNMYMLGTLDKPDAAHLLHSLGRLPETQAIILIDEAWMLVNPSKPSGSPDDPPDWRQILDGYEKVSDHPFRQEVVIATLESRTEGCWQFIAAITRTDDGTPSLGPWEKRQSTVSLGRLQGFLK